MLRFCGTQIELVIDSILQRREEQPAVCSATDEEGRHWLIVEGPHDEKDLSWFCAPATERMVKLVESGQASALDAVRHSETGWVEVVRVVDGHSVPDWRLPCFSLSRAGVDTVE